MLEQQIIKILNHILQLGDRSKHFNQDTALLGSLPEFDSMAVVSVITSLEEEFGITIEDDDIEAATFTTVGSLTAFVAAKLN